MKDIVDRLKFWIDNAELNRKGLVNDAIVEIKRLRKIIKNNQIREQL